MKTMPRAARNFVFDRNIHSGWKGPLAVAWSNPLVRTGLSLQGQIRLFRATS